MYGFIKSVYNQYRRPIKSYLKFNAVIEKGIDGDNPEYFTFGQQTKSEMSFGNNCEEVLNQHKSRLSSIIENFHDLEGIGHIKSVSIV